LYSSVINIFLISVFRQNFPERSPLSRKIPRKTS